MNTGTSRLFRRASDPVVVPATDVASEVDVPALPKGVTSFCAVNAYPVWIRLKGTSAGQPVSKVEEGKGWLFPPGHFGIYSTQFPGKMSGMAVERPGFPIKDAEGNLLYPDAAIEISYGSGA